MKRFKITGNGWVKFWNEVDLLFYCNDKFTNIFTMILNSKITIGDSVVERIK